MSNVILPACLAGFITLGGACDEAPPTSGYTIQALKGLSIDNISAIAPEAIETAKAALADALGMANKKLESKLRAVLTERGIDLNRRGALYTPCSFTTGAAFAVAKDRGLRVSRAWLKTRNNVLGRIVVETITIKSAIDGDTTLKVTDSDDVVLWSKDISLKAGQEAKVKVGQTFEPEVIYIVADNTNISPFETDCTSGQACCGKNFTYGYNGNHKATYNGYLERETRPVYDGYTKYDRAESLSDDLVVEGWTGDGTNTVGYLSACLRLSCSDKNIVCNFKDRLALALLHYTGVELLEEWLSPSKRINLIKTFGKTWAAEKLDDWTQDADDFLYNELDAIILFLQKNDKFCYNCDNSKLGYLTTLPG